MSSSFCGTDCSSCNFRMDCFGCIESCGKPFGEGCFVAALCGKNPAEFQIFKQKLIAAINALNISEMGVITELYALRGSFVSIEYTLPGGQKTTFLHDNKIYLGNQIPKGNSGRFFGIAADEHCLLVSEYGENGTDAELVLFRHWA